MSKFKVGDHVLTSCGVSSLSGHKGIIESVSIGKLLGNTYVVSNCGRFHENELILLNDPSPYTPWVTGPIVPPDPSPVHQHVWVMYQPFIGEPFKCCALAGCKELL